MRDMAKRVREYKELYRRRRLDPLALVVMYNRMGPQVLICGSGDTPFCDPHSSLRGLRITHAALQSDFSALQSDCKVLQTNYAALQAECRDLQSTTSRLSSTIEYYKRNVAILKDDIEILKGRNGRMAQRVEELEAEKLTRHPGSLLDEAQDDSHREAEAQVKSSELEKMTNDLANLRRDFAAVNPCGRQKCRQSRRRMPFYVRKVLGIRQKRALSTPKSVLLLQKRARPPQKRVQP
ncbi:hypothetical protein K525DRAFT_275576 [Schizophyllum commune Loenen D]|nr:hypothetical protein K525DRAFT_275576 [Schizophyllum commune Loenen D]